MSLAIEPLTDVQDWATRQGLEIVLLVTGALLLARFVSWSGSRITDRIDATAQEDDALVRSEAVQAPARARPGRDLGRPSWPSTA